MRDGWERMRLDDAAEVTIGRQRSPRHATGSHVVPYMRSANVKDGSVQLDDVLEMNFTPDEQAVYSLDAGDVLVTEGCGSIRELGASARWTGDLPGVVCFQNTLLRLRARPGVALPEFIEQWARWAHASGIWAGVGSGTNIFHIGVQRAREVPIDLPPLADQRRIVDLIAACDLSSLTFDLVDRCRVARGAILDRVHAEATDFVSLERVTSTAKAGATPSRKQPANFAGPVPWLKSGEVEADAIASTEESISDSALAASSTWLMPPRTIVVAMYGQGPTAGSVGYTAVPMACNQAVLGIVPDDERIDRRFLFHWLRSRKSAMRERRVGSSQPNLSKELVLQELVPQLPSERQHEIAGLLDALLNEESAAIRTQESLKETRAALLSDLLSCQHAIPDAYDTLLEPA